jgi:uncharacterized protein
MLFENGFTVAAPPDEVFATLMDVRGVASCLPGASIGADTGDGGLEATVAVKVGPIRMTYGGTVRVTERDDAARTAAMRVTAREQRGQGTAEATISLAVTRGSDGGAHAGMTTDLMVTGRIAQMGAGIMQDIARSMVDEFAACLSARLAPGAPAPPAGATASEAPAAPPPAEPPAAAREVKALPLLWKAIKARIARLFGRS